MVNLDFEMSKVDCIYYNVINILILFSPVTNPRSAVLGGWGRGGGLRLRSNTADREPVTGQIRNNMINVNFVNDF